MSGLEHFDQELLAIEERVQRPGTACGVEFAGRRRKVVSPA
jgi:hypothetical protein